MTTSGSHAVTGQVRDPRTRAGTPPENTETPDGSPVTGRRRRRWWRWAAAVVIVVGLVVLAAGRVTASVGAQAADDPRSSTKAGSGAVAALLEAQGVRVDRADDPAQAARLITAEPTPATLVIINPERLRSGDIATLQRSRPARTVLVRPNNAALRAFGTGVRTGTLPQSATLAPACSDPLATRAGVIAPDADANGLVPNAPLAGCYADSGTVRYLRAGTAGGQLDLVADGFANERLAREGNAAFATGLLGSQPRVVWLMSTVTADTTPHGPGLLPDWWLIFLAQVVIAVAVLAVWRGRRLGPIMIESLPVVVRASETVEGHGRLYQRIQARDRAAAALRAGVIVRLGPRYGQSTDVHRLAEALAERTGRDAASILRLLDGADPATDTELNQLAHDLDQLEQEARTL